jgi:hypothetical protein
MCVSDVRRGDGRKEARGPRWLRRQEALGSRERVGQDETETQSISLLRHGLKLATSLAARAHACGQEREWVWARSTLKDCFARAV